LVGLRWVLETLEEDCACGFAGAGVGAGCWATAEREQAKSRVEAQAGAMRERAEFVPRICEGIIARIKFGSRFSCWLWSQVRGIETQ
jgi:hypothetical protein